MWTANGWKDYELLDCGDGDRLERWCSHFLVRAYPQAIWPRTGHPAWESFGGRYIRSSTGGGSWDIRDLPGSWRIGYGELCFNIKPMNFKHMGVFPEQAANWDWFSEVIRRAGRPVSVLNLFAYTGGATLAASAAGAEVCHVDAARGMVSLGRENAGASGLSGKPIRWIVDDCEKFIVRELRRGKRYDAVIMDPPSYGRGPSGEIWKIEEQLASFVRLCVQILSDNPLFFLINSYSTGLSPSVSGYLLGMSVMKRYGGSVQCGEIGLACTKTGLALPCGASGRWVKE